VKPERSRSSIVLRIAATISIAVILVVVFAARRWKTAETPAIESSSIPRRAEESSPEPIDSLDETASRVAVRPSRPVPRPAPQPAPVAPPTVAASAANGIRLFGDLRDTSGRPLDTDEGVIRGCDVAGTKFSEIRGSAYRIDGLSPGEVGLECSAHNYRPQTLRLVLGPREVEHRLDVVFVPDWFVDVQLDTPDGRSLTRETAVRLVPGASFHFAGSKAPPPAAWISGSFEERRARRLVGDTHGSPDDETAFTRLLVLGDPPLHLSVDVRGVVLASTRLDDRVERARLVVPIDRVDSLRCAFTCVLVDGESGAPFSRNFVTLSGVSMGGINRVQTLVADATGRIRREELLPGRYSLSLRGMGPAPDAWSARKVQRFELRDGDDLDLGTIALDPSQHAAGRFVDAKGRPVEGRGTIRPLSLDDGVDSASDGFDMQIGRRPSGGFLCDGLGKERYVLVANGRPWGNPKGDLLVGNALVDLSGGSVDDLVVTLAVAQQICLRPETEEATDFVYRLVNAAGVPFEHGELMRPRTYWLAPGDYSALVGPDVAHLREIPFTLGTEALTIKVEP
jgi:hypothetical protein